MKNKIAMINKATFTKKEVFQRLIKFYLLWLVVGIISLGISLISRTESYTAPELWASIITWILFGFISVSFFDYFLTSYGKINQLLVFQDGKKFDLECRFNNKNLELTLKEVFRMQIQSKFTKNTDKIFIRYRRNERPHTVSIIIKHEDLTQIEFIKRHIK